MMPGILVKISFVAISMSIAGCGGNSATPQVDNPQAQNANIDDQPDMGTNSSGNTTDSTQQLADLQGLWSSGCVLDNLYGQSSDSAVFTRSLNGNNYQHTSQFFTDSNCVDIRPLSSGTYHICDQVTSGPLLPLLTSHTIVESGILNDAKSDLIPTPLGGATEIHLYPESIRTGAGESLAAYDCGDIDPFYESMYLVSGNQVYFEFLDDVDYVNFSDDIEAGDSDTESDPLNNGDMPRVLDLDYPYTRVQ